jgi:diacylglycerol kinase (ATP)
MSLKHPVIRSFPFAIEGLKTAIKNEPNFRVHILVGFIVLLFAVILNFNQIELAILTLTIGMVIILELINTMLEAVVDLVSPEIRKEAKLAKDVAAGSVLVSAILAVMIGLLLFLPKLI